MNVKGNIYDILEVYLEYKNKYLKIFEKEYGSKFNVYRHANVEEKEKNIKENLSQLPIHQSGKQRKKDELLWDYDAVSLYPSAIWDENNIYPRIETCYAYTTDMNSELVQNFNTDVFTRGSAILNIKYFNPKNLIVQHLPVKEKEKKIQINRMRNGYIIDTLASVDIQEIVKIGVKVIQIYEGVFYRENFEVSPFRKVNDKKYLFQGRIIKMKITTFCSC